jgi:hypothetical protein
MASAGSVHIKQHIDIQDTEGKFMQLVEFSSHLVKTPTHESDEHSIEEG